LVLQKQARLISLSHNPVFGGTVYRSAPFYENIDLSALALLGHLPLSKGRNKAFLLRRAVSEAD